MLAGLSMIRRETIRCSAVSIRNNSSNAALMLPHASPFALANRFYEEISNISWNQKVLSMNNVMTSAKATAPEQQRFPVVFDIINQQNSPSSVTTTIGEVSEYIEGLFNGILNVKRTFQPSLVRRKRKHGFLARAATRHGRDILNRRRAKGRSSLCA